MKQTSHSSIAEVIMFLSIKNVQKSYGIEEARTQVLSNVSVDLEEGEIGALLGPSGSGKSTLLNLVGGLETADEGLVTIDDCAITRLSPPKLAQYRRKYLGFIFQFYNLVPNLTVRENVELCEYLSLRPLNVEELLREMSLWEHRNKFPSQLSGGQQQRCAIARALVKNPRLLLCDEPTGALDSNNARDIMCLLERINKEYHTTLLIVSHNPVVEEMAHRVIRLKDGKIISNRINQTPRQAAELSW